MGRRPGEKGIIDQRRILEELATRWSAMQPQPTLDDLGAALDLDRTAVFRHVKKLRRLGLIHASAILITPAGYAEVRPSK